MAEELKDMKEKFFIDGKEAEEQNLARLLSQVMNYCKMDKSGKIFIEVEGITVENKVKVCLAARKIGSLLVDGAFKPEISAEDVASYIGTTKETAIARLADICNAKFAEHPGKGAYVAKTLYHVEKLLQHVKNNESCRPSKSKSNLGNAESNVEVDE